MSNSSRKIFILIGTQSPKGRCPVPVRSAVHCLVVLGWPLSDGGCHQYPAAHVKCHVCVMIPPLEYQKCQLLVWVRVVLRAGQAMRNIMKLIVRSNMCSPK
ncbi:hypothetical protein DPMN_050425 [Dreissena polymorpha]|uniref:Uncharacterized protein n=1 Tax=Dreissena polymorpha TaxID=45954 RepID=A0A9D4CH60_DREPO|nr:hypothetical protein DPMN_050425 [Dreissena polymorpha]